MRTENIVGSPSPSMPLTREPRTEQAYLKRAAELHTAAARYFEMDEAEPVSPVTVVNYLASQLPNLRPATVRYYRAALRNFFEKVIAEGDDAGTYSLALVRLGDIRPRVTRGEVPARGPAKKRKSLPVDDMRKLATTAAATNNFWLIRAVRFLQAGIAAGLRPIEWQQAEWINDTEIRVINAKHTNGRAHGVSRVVAISAEHWLAETVPVHMDLLRDWLATEGNTFEQYYTRCRKALQRACRQLWPRRESHITLYSGRHQFCANLKAAGRSRAEVAYAMGHGSEETAAAHYGKRRSGWRGLGPMSAPIPAPTDTLRSGADAPRGQNGETLAPAGFNQPAVTGPEGISPASPVF